MPDNEGNFKPISVPRVPWHERFHEQAKQDLQRIAGTDEEIKWVAMEYKPWGPCPTCGSPDVPCRCPD